MLFPAISISSSSAFRVAAARCTQVSGMRTRFYSSTMHDNDPQILEVEKTRNLSNTEKKHSPHEHAPEWNEKLASASEAAVKADKSTGSTEEMVTKTVEFMRVQYDDPSSEQPDATTDKDEVSGPLRGVGKEEQRVDVEIEEKHKRVTKKKFKTK